jgi:hypothetical protein
VGSSRSRVIDDQAGVCPFLYARKAGYEQRHSRERIPDPDDGHEVDWITEVPDYPHVLRILDEGEHSSHNAFGAKEESGDPVNDCPASGGDSGI